MVAVPLLRAHWLRSAPRGFERFGGDGSDRPSKQRTGARNEGAGAESGGAADQPGQGEQRGERGETHDRAERSDGRGEGTGGPGEPPPKFDLAWFQQLLFALAVYYLVNRFSSAGQTDEDGIVQREIDFQEFVRDFLQPGVVDHLEVVNKQVARVYLKANATAVGRAATWRRRRQQQQQNREDAPPSAHVQSWSGEADNATPPDETLTSPDDNLLSEAAETSASSSTSTVERSAAAADSRPPYRSPYYFVIPSPEIFEMKLDLVQKKLGMEPVPVIYRASNAGVLNEVLKALPSLLVLSLGFLLLRNLFGGLPGAGGPGRNIFQVGKANPIIFKKGSKRHDKITFADVAGLDEAKREVMELVDFLRNPRKYQQLGARIPKGALLVGPPGTGKTLLAKAAAGEADVPFLSMSGSDFIEMFVGVGPSRVRDLFAQARQNAPCIVFIDEIDAVGRARGRGGFGGGNDERENTLNALLVEMDGFSSQSGIVVLAGTNRADILDKALLRPGRFDRQISIDKPDLRGRYQVFKVHLRPLKIAAGAGDIEAVAKRLASLTPGFAGADIANICNEAALIAARAGKNEVEMADFEAATDRVIAGLEKKSKVLSREEREVIAHHEAGHAVAAWFLQHADPLLKISIVPRGNAALGFTQYLPRDRYLQSKDELDDFMTAALGGRAAERLVFGRVTTGAQDDLERVTRGAYAAVTSFGMSQRIGTVSFPREGEGDAQFQRPFSEETAQIVDAEARRIVDAAYLRCEELLSERLVLVRALAKRLLEKETVREADLVEILGPRPAGKPVEYDEFVAAYERDRQERMGTAANADDVDTTADGKSGGDRGGKRPGAGGSTAPGSERGNGTVPPSALPELA